MCVPVGVYVGYTQICICTNKLGTGHVLLGRGLGDWGTEVGEKFTHNYSLKLFEVFFFFF